MANDEKQVLKVAQRSERMLMSLTEQIQAQKEELRENTFYQVYAKAALAKLPKLTRASVDYAVNEMEENGYPFDKRAAGSSTKYAMSIQNIIDIYHHRGVPKYRDRHHEAFSSLLATSKAAFRKRSLPFLWHTHYVRIRICCLKICVFWSSIWTRNLPPPCS